MYILFLFYVLNHLINKILRLPLKKKKKNLLERIVNQKFRQKKRIQIISLDILDIM